MTEFYILKDKKPVPVKDIIEWERSLQGSQRIVKKDEIGEVLVSTVFLGIEHGYSSGKPILFETMIFGGENDQYQDRCCTWEEAEKMHQKALEMVTKKETHV